MPNLVLHRCLVIACLLQQTHQKSCVCSLSLPSQLSLLRVNTAAVHHTSVPKPFHLPPTRQPNSDCLTAVGWAIQNTSASFPKPLLFPRPATTTYVNAYSHGQELHSTETSFNPHICIARQPSLSSQHS